LASRQTHHAVDLGEALMVAGIGCRLGASAEEIDEAIKTALRQIKSSGRELVQIATAAAKGREPGVAAAARARGVPLVLIAQSDLEAANDRTLTKSHHSVKALNVQSLAETAALAAAGAGSRLLGPRVVVGRVTCALAVGANPP
jgi:cobalt-precorrin 5A hydrolase